MKILHIFDDYGTPGERALAGEGSVPTVVYYLAKYAAKRYDVTVLERDQGALPREEEIDGIRYMRVSAHRLPAAPYELIKSPKGLAKLARDGLDIANKINNFLKREDFDVVHFHFPFASSVLVNLNRGLRDNMVYTAHIGEERKRFALDPSAPLTFRLFSPDLYLMRRVRKSVVLNEPLRLRLIEKGIREERIEVIPNGVNVDDFSMSREEVERVRAKYRLEGITVLFAGTLTPRKGADHLVRAAELILKEREDVTFLLVGNYRLDEGFASKVMRYVRNRGLGGNIRFTGFVPYEDLKALYSACDIFVLPSLEEGFGVVLTEALASGKPLIGSNVGGIPMQIKDGWNGFLVEPANEEQLAEKIGYLLDNVEVRERMGKNSRALAGEEFDWAKIAERYLKLYEEVAMR